jgi:hypothetical protein
LIERLIEMLGDLCLGHRGKNANWMASLFSSFALRHALACKVHRSDRIKRAAVFELLKYLLLPLDGITQARRCRERIRSIARLRVSVIAQSSISCELHRQAFFDLRIKTSCRTPAAS